MIYPLSYIRCLTRMADRISAAIAHEEDPVVAKAAKRNSEDMLRMASEMADTVGNPVNIDSLPGETDNLIHAYARQAELAEIAKAEAKTNRRQQRLAERQAEAESAAILEFIKDGPMKFRSMERIIIRKWIKTREKERLTELSIKAVIKSDRINEQRHLDRMIADLNLPDPPG